MEIGDHREREYLISPAGGDDDFLGEIWQFQHGNGGSCTVMWTSKKKMGTRQPVCRFPNFI